MTTTNKDPLREPFIELRSGGRHFFNTPDKGDFNFVDLVWATSHICRFTGHVRKFYSVLQHCVEVSKTLRRWGHIPEVQLSGLMHDLHEGLINDMTQPLKRCLPKYQKIERVTENYVHAELCLLLGYFDIHYSIPQIGYADKALVLTEGRDLTNADTSYWNVDACPIDQKIIPVSSLAARRRFFRQLFRILKEMGRIEKIAVVNRLRGYED